MDAPDIGALLESQHVWIIFVMAGLMVVCMLEELWYQHPHPLCIICIIDGLLHQKLYDPLFFICEEYFYIPMCLIVEELFDILREFLEVIFPVLIRNEPHLRIIHLLWN
ncbi:unnamed protein product [Sphagnum troendelagicum]|uniref:Uncharacterized protein n=1 Tax=Sphagnum troendelagicum TaxID=128251 RepID=A0ABP0V2J5_9BRYO